MALYLSIYPGRMEGPPSSLSSASSYTPYWYNPVGSSTAVLSTATGTGGAAYGISVNNSYTAVNTTSVPSQYPSASQTAREGQTEDDSDCTVGTSDVEYDCTVLQDEGNQALQKKNESMYAYTVKIMNASKKSDYTMVKFSKQGQIETISDLKSELLARFTDRLSGDIEVGYIQPGHGLRGKQEWLCYDDDIQEMYDLHPRKKSILLWCFKKTSSDSSASRKRPRSSSSSQASNAQKISRSSTNYESHQRDKVAETNETLAKLEEKHGDKYSSEQLRTWANLIQLKKHSSLDAPPDYPFFRGRKKKQESESSADSKASTSPKRGDSSGAVPGVSPGKRLGMRSQCLDQLGKCIDILDKGGLSQAEFNELQKAILADIKTL